MPTELPRRFFIYFACFILRVFSYAKVRIFIYFTKRNIFLLNQALEKKIQTDCSLCESIILFRCNSYQALLGMLPEVRSDSFNWGPSGHRNRCGGKLIEVFKVKAAILNIAKPSISLTGRELASLTLFSYFFISFSCFQFPFM